jgi:hypothetical protein
MREKNSSAQAERVRGGRKHYFNLWGPLRVRQRSAHGRLEFAKHKTLVLLNYLVQLGGLEPPTS